MIIKNTGAIYMGLDGILWELSWRYSIWPAAGLLGMPAGILLLTSSNTLHRRQEKGIATLQ